MHRRAFLALPLAAAQKPFVMLSFLIPGHVTVLLANCEIRIPLARYPHLANATDLELQNWEVIGECEGIHWPDLDEDISI